ncbi:MAG TPA: PPC domain-containing DNA-binding protein [Desulfomonilaceae bacterium]|nr:PPC domain-containing DNA-binding protein [Desulfomonilaceae bacterium]
MEQPFVARLPKGEDLLEAITKVFQERSIRKATFNVIGAVTRGVLGYYDQNARQYRNQEFDRHMEIVSCMGNVSEKGDEVFAHAHIVFSGEDYQCVGGHLMNGSPIFAAELFAMPLSGKTPVRKFDEPTGLLLWSDS